MRIIFLYIILVGVMLAVLLEILRIGEKIKAPLDVSGRWIIKKEIADELQSSCSAIAFQKKDPRLSIEQSGQFLELSLNDSAHTVINGKLINDSLKFTGMLPVKKDIDSTCGTSALVELTFKLINSGNSTEKINGVWSTPNCSRCKQVNILAVKENHEQ